MSHGENRSIPSLRHHWRHSCQANAIALTRRRLQPPDEVAVGAGAVGGEPAAWPCVGA